MNWIYIKDRKPSDEDFNKTNDFLVCWENLTTKEKTAGIFHISEYTTSAIYEGIQCIGEKDYKKIIAFASIDLP